MYVQVSVRVFVCMAHVHVESSGQLSDGRGENPGGAAESTKQQEEQEEEERFSQPDSHSAISVFSVGL